ncbi:hypothetical protein [Pseudoalteromonas sp. PPB1]|uniref:hypothetical protein n=1 Tax=Pseudoalteromonas sp. PPB1 TaxID=2756136 RepID=UPI001890C078|nr:hypothetical protein [Pseudoalteromonas sp. PPB1]
MHKNFRFFALLVCFYFCFWPAWATSAQFDKVHLLLVSNGHYVDKSRGDKERDAAALVDFSGAHVSAMVVHSLLDKHLGLASSTLLRSDNRRIVSKDDVFNVLNSLKRKIDTKGQNEYLIVYYVGHGFGEGIAWNYFLQPGNVELPGRINSFDIEALANQLIYVGSLNDKLIELGLPYTLLIDACYEGSAVDLAGVSLLSDKAKQNLKDVSAHLKFMNQFRGVNPVVFSVQPGGTVRTVTHPLNPSLSYNIGPLARRLVLGARQWPSNSAVSLEQIIRSIQSPQLDERTKAAVSFADFGPGYSFHRTHSDTRVMVDRVWGSAKSTDLHLLQETYPNNEASTNANLGDSIEIEFATIAILGNSGEYISDGKDYVFTTGTEKISIETWTEDELVLHMELEGESWSFSIAAPEGERFEAKHYKNVHRHPFQEGVQAGLEVSGADRGCNEISGDFEIDSISYTGGIPSALSLSYRQFCENEQHPIRGTVIIEIQKAKMLMTGS